MNSISPANSSNLTQAQALTQPAFSRGQHKNAASRRSSPSGGMIELLLRKTQQSLPA
ncbi:MAG: hypothetical protein HY785_09495 [Oscillatoriophycideae cyanobacterium NC_groundwater_1537_Pr4_S-0.65um_50_18]|nr:hypothetical protein [Oscillatoriophycideae cyanobacterium NC_groundwater_1537_Pr4_S-0.65um_50_18]